MVRKNYPDTIQLGDVTGIQEEQLKQLPKIDILMGGSPCKQLSITNINNYQQGLKGKDSKLFFGYVRILNYIRPRYFLFENVNSMNETTKNYMTNILKVKPILINSNLVSAQDRERLYWTNILGIKQPKDKGILLKDIMEAEVDEKYYYKQPFDFHGWNKKNCATLHVSGHDIIKRVYNPYMKCATLTAVNGGYQEKKVLHKNRVRKLTPVEYERLQTLPDDYTKGISNTARYTAIGNGWTVDVIAHILKYVNLY